MRCIVIKSFYDLCKTATFVECQDIVLTVFQVIMRGKLKLRNVVTTKMLLESRFEWVFLLVKVNTTIKQHHLVFKEIDVRFILSR